MNELVLIVMLLTCFLVMLILVSGVVIGVLFLIEYRQNRDISKAFKCACESKL